jgi:putative transposase
MFLNHQNPNFFTATCLEWQYLLEQDKYKDFIINDLQWLVNYGWIKLYAFTIMPNHLHYIWHNHPELDYIKIKGGHLRNTSQKIKHNLILNNETQLLNKFYVGAKDRAYQFWERNPLSTELYTPKVIYQKLDYIHANPVMGKWNLCKEPKDYIYSSAEFYETGFDRFGMLTHIGEIGIWEKEPVRVKSKYFNRGEG